MLNDEYDKERIRLAESDLTLSNDFIKGVLATSAAVRASAITIWLALLGFAFQQRSAELALVAAIMIVAFWVADAYHGWLYNEASAHARAIESLLSEYYDAISRGRDKPDVVPRFRGRLRAFRYGLFLSFRAGFSVSKMWTTTPFVFYRILYPVLAALAVAASIAIGTGIIAKQSPAAPTRVIIEQPTTTPSVPTPSP